VLEWLQNISPERLLMLAVAVGVGWAELRQARRSLRDQGRRIGALEKGEAARRARETSGDGR
jgi:hypothetical protein